MILAPEGNQLYYYMLSPTAGQFASTLPTFATFKPVRIQEI
jgi:hypothetical protein